jgi:hypothetical protein
MLKRISNQKSTINCQAFEDARKKQEERISHMAHFPHIFKVKGHLKEKQDPHPKGFLHIRTEEVIERNVGGGGLPKIKSMKHITINEPATIGNKMNP